MHVKCTTSTNNFSVISAVFLFLNEHPRLVPQTFSFPHIHLLVPEAVGHVMHSLFCTLQLLLDRICVVPFKSTHCVLQNSHLKCINQCLGNLFILVLVLGGKFLLFYYKFSLITWNTFFDVLEKRMQIFMCKPQTVTVCQPCRLCLLLCLFMLRDPLHLVFLDLHTNPFPPLLANTTSRRVWFAAGRIITLLEVQKQPENWQSRKQPGSDRQWHLRASEWASSSSEPPPEYKS